MGCSPAIRGRAAGGPSIKLERVLDRSTKGMDATPLSSPRSPCPGEASEGGSEGMNYILQNCMGGF
jgi:hypothetical protein